jgi:hypothetical protein
MTCAHSIALTQSLQVLSLCCGVKTLTHNRPSPCPPHRQFNRCTHATNHRAYIRYCHSVPQIACFQEHLAKVHNPSRCYRCSIRQWGKARSTDYPYPGQAAGRNAFLIFSGYAGPSLPPCPLPPTHHAPHAMPPCPQHAHTPRGSVLRARGNGGLSDASPFSPRRRMLEHVSLPIRYR